MGTAQTAGANIQEQSISQCEIIFHVAQTVNTEQLQKYIP